MTKNRKTCLHPGCGRDYTNVKMHCMGVHRCDGTPENCANEREYSRKLKDKSQQKPKTKLRCLHEDCSGECCNFANVEEHCKVIHGCSGTYALCPNERVYRRSKFEADPEDRESVNKLVADGRIKCPHQNCNNWYASREGMKSHIRNTKHVHVCTDSSKCDGCALQITLEQKKRQNQANGGKSKNKHNNDSNNNNNNNGIGSPDGSGGSNNGSPISSPKIINSSPSIARASSPHTNGSPNVNNNSPSKFSNSTPPKVITSTVNNAHNSSSSNSTIISNNNNINNISNNNNNINNTSNTNTNNNNNNNNINNNINNSKNSNNNNNNSTHKNITTSTINNSHTSSNINNIVNSQQPLKRKAEEVGYNLEAIFGGSDIERYEEELRLKQQKISPTSSTNTSPSSTPPPPSSQIQRQPITTTSNTTQNNNNNNNARYNQIRIPQNLLFEAERSSSGDEEEDSVHYINRNRDLRLPQISQFYQPQHQQRHSHSQPNPYQYQSHSQPNPYHQHQQRHTPSSQEMPRVPYTNSNNTLQRRNSDSNINKNIFEQEINHNNNHGNNRYRYFDSNNNNHRVINNNNNNRIVYDSNNNNHSRFFEQMEMDDEEYYNNDYSEEETDSDTEETEHEENIDPQDPRYSELIRIDNFDMDKAKYFQCPHNNCFIRGDLDSVRTHLRVNHNCPKSSVPCIGCRMTVEIKMREIRFRSRPVQQPSTTTTPITTTTTAPQVVQLVTRQLKPINQQHHHQQSSTSSQPQKPSSPPKQLSTIVVPPPPQSRGENSS